MTDQPAGLPEPPKKRRKRKRPQRLARRTFVRPDVIRIAQLAGAGNSLGEIAKKTGIPRSTVQDIVIRNRIDLVPKAPHEMSFVGVVDRRVLKPIEHVAFLCDVHLQQALGCAVKLGAASGRLEEMLAELMPEVSA